MSESDEMKSFWMVAHASPTGVVVTTFPTRERRWRGRLHADGHSVYTDADYDSIADLFSAIADQARGT
jgi:hypothetical protein